MANANDHSGGAFPRALSARLATGETNAEKKLTAMEERIKALGMRPTLRYLGIWAAVTVIREVTLPPTAAACFTRAAPRT